MNNKVLNELKLLYADIEYGNALLKQRLTECEVMQRHDEADIARMLIKTNERSYALLATLSARLASLQSRALFLIPDLDKMLPEEELNMSDRG